MGDKTRVIITDGTTDPEGTKAVRETMRDAARFLLRQRAQRETAEKARDQKTRNASERKARALQIAQEKPDLPISKQILYVRRKWPEVPKPPSRPTLYRWLRK